MDLSIGGYELPGQQDGYLSVWAITAPGRVSSNFLARVNFHLCVCVCFVSLFFF